MHKEELGWKSRNRAAVFPQRSGWSRNSWENVLKARSYAEAMDPSAVYLYYSWGLCCFLTCFNMSKRMPFYSLFSPAVFVVRCGAWNIQNSLSPLHQVIQSPTQPALMISWGKRILSRDRVSLVHPGASAGSRIGGGAGLPEQEGGLMWV